jgi:hypothetical protein
LKFDADETPTTCTSFFVSDEYTPDIVLIYWKNTAPPSTSKATREKAALSHSLYYQQSIPAFAGMTKERFSNGRG